MSALVASFFVPVIPPNPMLLGYPPAKLAVLALTAATVVLSGIAHVRREDPRLYTTALVAAGIGALLHYFVAALFVGLVIALILTVLAH